MNLTCEHSNLNDEEIKLDFERGANIFATLLQLLSVTC